VAIGSSLNTTGLKEKTREREREEGGMAHSPEGNENTAAPPWILAEARRRK